MAAFPLYFFSLGLLFHFCFFFAWRAAVSARGPKTLAWGLTLEISVLDSLLGAYWAWAFCGALARGTALPLLAATTPFDELCITFMMSYLAADLALGLLFYRPQLRVDTTYVHHVAYFLLEGYCVLHGFTRYYLIFAILELPTCVLALGSAFPSMRSDAAFGATFFATRIVFEVFVAGALLAVRAPIPLHLLLPPVAASLAMHVVWLRSWMAPKGKAV